LPLQWRGHFASLDVLKCPSQSKTFQVSGSSPLACPPKYNEGGGGEEGVGLLLKFLPEFIPRISGVLFYQEKSTNKDDFIFDAIFRPVSTGQSCRGKQVRGKDGVRSILFRQKLFYFINKQPGVCIHSNMLLTGKNNNSAIRQRCIKNLYCILK